MVLSLISPVGGNFIKDFPGQNAINCDRIDAYAGPCLRTQPLVQFTPILKAVTTDPVLGTGGTNTGYYYKIFDQIYMWGDFRYGSGFNAGSGIYIIELPFTISDFIGGDTSIIGKSQVVGNGSVWDNDLNAGKLPVTVQMRTFTQLQFGTRMNSGIGARHLTHSGYITWAQGDGLNWAARFKRVP